MNGLIEYKSLVEILEIKVIDDAKGIIKGYLSTFNNVDRTKDRVRPGAFKKTIAESLQRKTNTGKKFIWPLLWMHDPEKPIGGVIDAIEDQKGLLITAQLDISVNSSGVPNNPLATSTFSGFLSGYVDELSMGYKAIQKDYDSAGVRDLKEVQVWEASCVTSLFAANEEALVDSVKSASGSGDWPLADRSMAWDGSEAHEEIVKWATKIDGSLNTAKMKSVHFWYDKSNENNVTAYKLPFCDIIGGKAIAVPKAIFACAEVLDGGMDGVQLGNDTQSVKNKVAHYYDRMAKHFSDPSIIPPWKKQSKGYTPLMDIKSGKAISAANAKMLQNVKNHLDTMANQHEDMAVQQKAMADQHNMMAMQHKAMSSDIGALLGTPENFDGSMSQSGDDNAKTYSYEPLHTSTQEPEYKTTQEDDGIALDQFKEFLAHNLKSRNF